MKPLNLNTTGCDPISSNCVIWQGPDIPCIKLCKGDTVSDVVFKLATELCQVLEALDVTTYDLPTPCFNNQACNPSDFHALIQLIIYKICCLEDSGDEISCANAGGTAKVSSSARTASESSGTCPDCYVTIAKCFQYTNEFGDLVESMKLDEYTRMIGNKVCDLVNQITNLTYVVNDLDLRVTALENTPPPTIALPTVTPVCVISPSVPVNMNIVLSALEQQFCSLVSVTGSPNNISNAIAKQCIGLNGSQALGPYGGTMAALSGWITTANTLAASMNNMWLTICDLRAAVQNIKQNCCPSGCDGVEIKLTAVLSGTELRIFLNGILPPGFSDCGVTGNLFKVTDGYGSSVNTNISVASYINDPIGFPLNIGVTPLNILTNLTVSSDICVTDGTSTCQFCVTYTVVNISTCPTITIIPDVLTGTSVTVLYTPLYVPGTYTTEVWSNDFTTMVASVTQNLTTVTPVTQNIPGLAPGTTYHVRLLIEAGGNVTDCPYTTFATNPALCLPPSAVAASVQIPVDCPMCGPALEFTDNVTVDGTYVDVTSDYLINYTSGSPDDLLQVCSDTSIDGAAAVRKGITFGGRTWITEGVSVYVYSNTNVLPTIDATITPAIPAGSIVDMAYDSNLDLVFFVYNDTSVPLSGGLRRIGTINPTTYAVTMNVAPAWSGAGYFATRIMVNPVTFEKYLDCADGNLYIADNGATITTVTAVPTGVVGVNFYANYGFNTNTGDAWVLTNDSTSTNQIAVVNGTTYAITWVNATGIGTYKQIFGSSPYFAETITYYPGDGTIGSDRMFVLYATTGPYNYIIQEFDATTFTNSTYLNDAAADIAFNPRTIMYSTIYNKIVYTENVSVHMYDPASSAVDFNSGLVLTAKGFNPQEDTVNDLIVMSGALAGPSTNYFWLCLDPANATQCTEGIVDLYIGNQGPFIYNDGTLSWDAMVTASVAYSTPGAGQFTVTGIFGSASVVTAALLVSTDYGFTYIPYNDASGNLYANVATWATGRIYNNPLSTWQMKIVFTTTDNCSLQSSLI